MFDPLRSRLILIRPPAPPPRVRFLLRSSVLFLSATLFLQGCSLAGGRGTPPPTPGASRPGWTQTGFASWYGEPFHGRTTASGEEYDMNQLTSPTALSPSGRESGSRTWRTGGPSPFGSRTAAPL